VTFSGSFDGPQRAKGTLDIGWDPGNPYRCEIGAEPWTATTTSPPLPPEAAPPKTPATGTFGVRRAGVKRGELRMLVEIKGGNYCKPARGDTRQNCRVFLYIAYRSSGRTTKFKVWINSATLKIRRRLPRSQRKTNTGIVTVTYPTNAWVQRYSVRLRIRGQRFTVLRAD
jgi:hypothetical protein